MAGPESPTRALFMVGVCQLTSGADKRANRFAVARLVGQAAGRGARLVVLPEMWPYYGPARGMAEAAEPLDGPSAGLLRNLARLHRVWLVGGSIPEAGGSGGKVWNTSLLVAPDGAVAATYRKIHLFDVDIPGKVRSRESESYTAGAEVVSAGTPLGLLGLTVCYDLRFPELYRALAARGCAAIAVPSAFTAVTGAAHWETLLRARAIEDQVFVLASNQVGEHPGRPASFGHSMVVDPWGRVLASVEGEGVAIAALDLSELEKIRRELPALRHGRPDLFGVGVPGSAQARGRGPAPARRRGRR
ncbi:MAG: carbon-nitrogen hydrolase family protein [Planctomycetales bacterium]|nr:carbon-nitrogen hydrolase family protein [Planctomycetales bacterium]